MVKLFAGLNFVYTPLLPFGDLKTAYNILLPQQAPGEEEKA